LSEPVGVVICGAAGRMGRRLVALAHAGEHLVLRAAIEAPGAASVGADAGTVAGGDAIGVAIGDDLAAACGPDDVVIDFTAPAATVLHAEVAAARGAALVVGTTGLDTEQDRRLRSAAERTRAVIAANYSAGITVLTELVAIAARRLDPSFEVEIVELHHHDKKDAPSGTALALGRAAATGRAQVFEDTAVLAREGLVGARRPDEIGLAALRGGDVVGDHTVLFVGLGERLELTHRAQSRDCLVRGALLAARWVVDQPAGIYGMRDVIGLAS
jgi:4-hydroxy-tetrahydrodipicolinate reductase